MKKIKILKVLMVSILSLMIFTACSKETARDSFNLYKDAFENKDYETMYSLLSNDSKEYISKEEFIERYTNIYGGINAEDIKVLIKEEDNEEENKKEIEDKENIEFTVKMNTLAGEIQLDDYKAKMIEEKQDDKKSWFIHWREPLIFPQMERGDKVRITTKAAKRGEIYDRDEKPLAINGKRYSIGIYPAVYDRASNSILAGLLDIDEEIIVEKLESNTNPEHFIPIVKLAVEDVATLTNVLAIEGMRHLEVDDRVYPGGEAFGSLIGYIKPITAEELEGDEDGAYHNTSLIGKLGLEAVYEPSLRAKDGKEIYISKIEDEKEVKQITLAKSEAIDGEDLTITVDTSLQQETYKAMNGDAGAATAIHPKTGEVISMVSSPSFDSNIYTTYISNTQRRQWEEMERSPFENRFNKAYSPGSTFKIVTAAIGLETGKIDPLKKISIEEKRWQKDSSWGGYYINRISEKLSQLDLNDAFIYSDNIYFAKTALDIGENDILQGSKKFGFEEELAINYPFAPSQISTTDKLEKEILLADTGYGQGQVLMSPLHLSLVYSMLVNNGNMMKPMLQKDDSLQPKIWKENIVTEENRKILLNSLVNVIKDKEGTGHDAKIENMDLAGKTGTAELKLSQDEEGQDNGWFVAMNVDNPKIVISMMIENVEGRGGSNYVVLKIRDIMDYYLNRK